MKVLLSIKPQYAKKIFDGEKQYEYRRSLFANRMVRTVIVYASSPVKMIVGEFDIEDIINDTLESLWKQTEHKSGITEDYFYKYFRCKDKGYAIKVGNPMKYAEPLPLNELYDMRPPQSFAYVT